MSNTGKTTLLKTLNPEKTLIISRDGKKFPYAIPKKTIVDFTDVDDLIGQIEEAVGAFHEKFGYFPETVGLDSISKIFLDIEAKILARVKSFPYGEINKEITKLVDFLEHTIATNCNLVMVSHALLNVDTGGYDLVNAGGSWGKKGGMISEVDNSIFIEIKNKKKRIIHHRAPALASRTVLEDLPDSQDIEEYNLQEHIDALSAQMDESDTYEL